MVGVIFRAFADINPDRGSKAAGKKKKIQSVNPAVLRLLSALAAFQV
jgi:hypothetical protein